MKPDLHVVDDHTSTENKASVSLVHAVLFAEIATVVVVFYW